MTDTISTARGDARTKSDKLTPKVRMGDGNGPAKILKHIARAERADAPTKSDKLTPKVRMGDGNGPATILKHIARPAPISGK